MKKTPAQRQADHRARIQAIIEDRNKQIIDLYDKFLTQDELARILARGLPPDLQKKLRELTKP